MNCKKCGNQVAINDKFCRNCGEIINEIIAPNNNMQDNFGQNQFNSNQQQMNNYTNQQVYNYQNFQTQPTYNTPNYVQQQFNKTSSWKNTVSIIIGVLCLILVFIFQIFTMPFSIIGIIFGILSTKENKKNKVGLVLNIISFVIAIPILLLYIKIFNISLSNPTVGTWDCKAFNNGDNKHLDYVITLKLDNNDRFKWNTYEDENNNYMVGKYEFTDLQKTNNDGSAKYYRIKLISEKGVLSGEIKNNSIETEYEMGIIKEKDEAILINARTYNMYYCHRKTKSVPEI